MKLRHLIDRRPVVIERVNLEASRKPDARSLFATAKAEQERAQAEEES